MGQSSGTADSDTTIEVGIVSADLEPLVAFYRDVFGFEPTVSFTADNGEVHKFRRGRAGLKIFVPLTTPEPNRLESLGAREGISYLALGVADAETSFRRAVQAGAAVVLEPVSHRPGAVTAVVRDPGGNLVEILEDRGADPQALSAPPGLERGQEM